MALTCLQNQVFWASFDLTSAVASVFEGVYGAWIVDWYISRTYTSEFSRDPFGDSMTNILEMSDQLKISWSKYVQDALAEKWCSLSNEKVCELGERVISFAMQDKSVHEGLIFVGFICGLCSIIFDIISTFPL